MSTYLYARQICGSRGWNVAIERRRRDADALCDLRHADIWIGEHCLGGLDVLVRQFRRTASGAANAPRGGETPLECAPESPNRSHDDGKQSGDQHPGELVPKRRARVRVCRMSSRFVLRHFRRRGASHIGKRLTPGLLRSAEFPPSGILSGSLIGGY